MADRRFWLALIHNITSNIFIAACTAPGEKKLEEGDIVIWDRIGTFDDFRRSIGSWDSRQLICAKIMTDIFEKDACSFDLSSKINSMLTRLYDRIDTVYKGGGPWSGSITMFISRGKKFSARAEMEQSKFIISNEKPDYPKKPAMIQSTRPLLTPGQTSMHGQTELKPAGDGEKVRYTANDDLKGDERLETAVITIKYKDDSNTVSSIVSTISPTNAHGIESLNRLVKAFKENTVIAIDISGK